MTVKEKLSYTEDTKRRNERRRKADAKRTAYNQDVWLSRFDLIFKGPVDKARRQAAEKCFRTFCDTYGGGSFYLPFSEYHLKAIKKMEAAALRGKKLAFAMPRGSGKTMLCHWLMLWATLCGHCRYVCFIGATEKKSKKRLANFKRTLRYNALLREDFPEICVLIDAFKNDPLTAKNQKFGGVPTDALWTTEDLVYPTWSLDELPDTYTKNGEDHPFDDSKKQAIRRNYADIGLGFGAVVAALSIEGDLRGANYERPDGETVRPDLVVLDDPQTRKSAKSIGMVEDRERKLNGDIKYMAGPGDSLGVVMPCTVIYENDLADRYLNREKHPNFNGERSQMLEEMPDNWDDPIDCRQRFHWDHYRKLQISQGEKAATEYYRINRSIMDDGFNAAWKERYDADDGEISAIQHAINLYYEDEASFWAEAQNNPSKLEGHSAKQLTDEDILAATGDEQRRIVPSWADGLVAYIDISEKCFWYVVVAYQKETFRSHVVDFKAYPDQKINYYTLSTLRRTLQKKHPDKKFAEILEEELNALINRLVERGYKNEVGEHVEFDAIGVDSSWGEYTVDVYSICKNSDYSKLLYPMKGKGVTPRTKPVVDPEAAPKKERTKKSLIGQWIISRVKVAERSYFRLLTYSTNQWKSTAAKMFRAVRDRLTVFRASKDTLQVFADQCSAEYCEREKGREIEFDVWYEEGNRDNHFLDCLVGCLVLAHRKGAQLIGGRKKIARTKETKHHKQTKDQRTKARGRRRRTSVNF